MGKTQSRVQDSPANVINEVENIVQENCSPESICLIIITVYVILQAVYKIFKIYHNNTKKKYLNRNMSINHLAK